MRVGAGVLAGRRPLGPVVGAGPAQVAGVLALGGAAGLALASTGSFQLPIGLMAFGAMTALGFLRPAAFLALFLLARPLLDGFSDNRYGGAAGANPAGLVALLLVAVLLVALATSRQALLPPATGALGFMLVTSALAAGYALVQLRGTVGTEPITELARLTALAATYVLAANLFSSVAAVRRLWALIGLSAVIPAVYGIVLWVQGGQTVKALGIQRIDSTFVGPNAFAAYLAVAAIVLICAPTGLRRLVRYPALAVTLIALVSTYSREGWFLFLFGVVALEWRRRTATVVTVMLATLAVVFAVPSVHDRVLPPNTHTIQSAKQKATFESWSWRVDTWRILLDKYQESPLVGFGLRSTPYVNPRRVSALGPPDDGYAAHNTAVKSLVEGGPALLFAWIAVFAGLLRAAVGVMRSGGALRRHGAVMAVLWAGVVIVSLSTDDPTNNTSMMYALLAMAGCMAGATSLERQQATEPPARSSLAGHDVRPLADMTSQ